MYILQQQTHTTVY